MSTQPTFDVCVVGSANLDLVATTDRLPGPGETVMGSTYAEFAGGKGLNQAVAASRAGARTAFAGAVGGDDAARQLIAVMDAEFIDRSALVELSDAPTGRALIGVSSSGENSIIVVPGANGRLKPNDVRAAAGSGRVLLVQREVPAVVVREALAAAKQAGALTILNPAPASRVDEDTLALCDIVIPNEHEVQLLGGVTTLLDFGVSAVVVTLGSRGAMLCRPGQPVLAIPALRVEAIDTTGAGDAFCGAFAAAMSRGVDIVDALRFASAAGALATTVRGAVPSLPHREAIEALLTNAG